MPGEVPVEAELQLSKEPEFSRDQLSRILVAIFMAAMNEWPVDETMEAIRQARDNTDKWKEAIALLPPEGRKQAESLAMNLSIME